MHFHAARPSDRNLDDVVLEGLLEVDEFSTDAGLDAVERAADVADVLR